MAVEAVPEQESVVGAGNMVIRDVTCLQMLQHTMIAEPRPEQGFVVEAEDIKTWGVKRC